MTGARIPFALVGVLILVGSASFVGSLQPAVAPDQGVDEALDKLGAETQSAVRDGVSTASRDAARNPVTLAANTTAGGVLNDSGTFRDSLRLRVYIEVRDRLHRLSARSNGLTLTADLPPTKTATALRRAKHRVRIERAGDRGSAVRATVSNITLSASRDGRVVGTESISPTVTVPVPTLFVHDRVQTFEQRLNAGPGQPGLGSRLTAPLYALTWVRGYAQFGGAPIDNVVTNRHIGLLTNGAVLSMQRTFFGQRDQRGAALLGWATANTALTDIVDGTNHTATKLLSTVHNDVQAERAPAFLIEQQQSESHAASPKDTVTIGINETADRAFLGTVRRLNQTLQQPYRVEARRLSDVAAVKSVVLAKPDAPRENWTLLNVSVRTETTVADRDGRERDLSDPWHRLSSHHKWVNRTQTVRRTWNTSSGRQETIERHRTAHAVRITIAGRHDGGDAPLRPFRSIHARGGVLDGPNLAGIEENAREKLLTQRGGAASVARHTVKRGGDTLSVSVTGELPSNISAWVYRDLVTVRERVRNISITVSKGALATMQVNPANRLRAQFETRRPELRGVPQRYAGVASRARIAARDAFLDRVHRRLQNRSDRHNEQRSKLATALAETDAGSLEGLQTGFESRHQSPSGPSGSTIQMRVNTAPSYLTLGELTGDKIPGIPSGTTEHPLVAHNRNLFTVPYGDAADAVVDGALAAGRTRLRTAAQVLSTASNVGLETNETTQLRSELAKSNLAVKSALVHSLRLVPNKTVAERHSVVQAGLSRWEGPAAIASALANGTAAGAIRAVATERWNLSYAMSDRVGLVLERTLADVQTAKAARPPQKPVSRHFGTIQRLAADRVKGAIENATTKGIKKAIAKRTGKSLSRLPAGLPLAPVPPYWYLTFNYWEVQVAGEYARFAVTVPQGSPDQAGARFTYVRDGNTVELDVDDDGIAETLGRGTRVEFKTQTSVAIAVPPRPRGVGDVDGQMNESSPGWPTPGAGEHP